MEDIKLMPDPLDIREITFTNILMLGFDVEAKESEHRTSFNRDMFATPNIKGMEVLLHFLFTKLNHDSAKEVFRGCWPIVEKRQAAEFRRVVADWLNKLIKESDCFIPKVQPVLLISPSGNRFYQFLFYFSLYILRQKMGAISKNYGPVPGRPTVDAARKNYSEQLAKAQDLTFINKQKRLVDVVKESEHLKSMWTDYASELSKEHRKMCKSKRDWEKRSKEVTERMQLHLGKSSVSAKDVLKRTNNLRMVKEKWLSISKFYEAQVKLMDGVEKVTSIRGNLPSLNGSNINFKIPDLLVRECEKQLHLGRKYENIYEEGKVDLNSLVNLWNLSLHLTKEALTQFPLPNASNDEAYLAAESHKHVTHLNTIISLKHMLKNQISDLKLSIEVLKEYLGEKSVMKEEDPPAKLPEKFSLDILPSTPSLVFEPASDADSFGYPKNDLSCGHTVATPDAVQYLLDELDSNVHRGTPVNPIISKLISENEKHKIVGKNAKDRKTKIPSWKLKQKQKPSASTTTGFPSEKENVNPLSFKEKEKDDMTAAQRILVEQITESVVSNHNASMSEKTQNEVLSLHAFENPIEAFNDDIFAHQDKVMRTPQNKTGLSEASFASTTQPPKDFFTPIRDFSTDVDTSKEEGGNTTTNVFTPFIDVQSKQPAADELMLFTPRNHLADVKVSTSDVHKRPIVDSLAVEDDKVISPLTVSPDVEGVIGESYLTQTKSADVDTNAYTPNSISMNKVSVDDFLVKLDDSHTPTKSNDISTKVNSEDIRVNLDNSHIPITKLNAIQTNKFSLDDFLVNLDNSNTPTMESPLGESPKLSLPKEFDGFLENVEESYTPTRDSSNADKRVRSLLGDVNKYSNVNKDSNVNMGSNANMDSNVASGEISNSSSGKDVVSFLNDMALTSGTPGMLFDISSSSFCNTPRFNNDFNLLTPEQIEKKKKMNLRNDILDNLDGSDDDEL